MSDLITKVFEFLAIGEPQQLVDFFSEHVVDPVIALDESTLSKVEVTQIGEVDMYVRLTVSSPKPFIGQSLKYVKAFKKAYVEDSDIPFTEAQIKKSFEEPDPTDKNAWKNRVIIPDAVWEVKTDMLIDECTP